MAGIKIKYMDQQTLVSVNENVKCKWEKGRRSDYIYVTGAANKEEARAAALHFFRNDEYGCDDLGITLDEGSFITWSYEEPSPADWEDHYVFYDCDAHPVDQREWWEK